MGATRTGGCLCGAVRYEAAPETLEVQACHCGDCRRWTSGPLLALVKPGKVSFTGAEAIGAYHSSAWGERGFCKVCGSTLYWRRRGTEVFEISAGTLDDQTGLTLVEQVYIDAKPEFYHFAETTKTRTEAEMVAARTGAAAGDQGARP